MKFMSFSNSCFYASIATMLEEFGVDIEDRDIIKDSYIPYTFQLNSSYEAGYQLQYSYLINHYLKRYNLSFLEKTFLLKEELIQSLKNETRKCVVSLMLENGAHAVVFTSYHNEVFTFLNMRREESTELDYICLKEEDLLKRLNPSLRYGCLQKGNKQVLISKSDVISNTVFTLEELKQDVIEHVQKSQNLNNRIIVREHIFRSLFISYLDVSDICGYKDINQRLQQSRKEYLNTFKMKESIILSKYIDLDYLIDTITLIQKKHLKSRCYFFII